MAAQGSDDNADDITTERDLFWAAVKEEADVEGSSRPPFASVYVKGEPSPSGDVPSRNVDVRLSPIEEVPVDQTAVKTEPDIGGQEEGGRVSPSSPALEEKETQYQSSEPPLKLPFKCNICRVGFPDKQLFLRHVLTHIGLPPAKCPHCPAAFKTAGELQQHLLGHSSERDGAASGGASPSGEPPGAGGSLNPPSVGRSGSKPAGVSPRLAPLLAGKSPPTVSSATHPSVPSPPSGSPATHAPPAEVGDPPRNSGAYKCRATGCGKRYATWRHLRRHVLYRAGAKPPAEQPPAAILRVPRCSGVYSCPVTDCERHSDGEHLLHAGLAPYAGLAPHACAACPRRFSDARGLASHAHVHCLDEECPTCGRLFPTRARLAAHERTHAAPRPFKCDACARTFKRKASLDLHAKVHASQRARHECVECGKRYHRPSRLAAHALAHAAIKPYLCEACGRGFASSSSLASHAATHTGERPYECDACGKAFARKQTIEVHCRLHTGDKPHGCETCGKRFAIKMTLELHRRTHTGEMPYECAVPTCLKRFRQALSLKWHSRRCRLVLPV